MLQHLIIATPTILLLIRPMKADKRSGGAGTHLRYDPHPDLKPPSLQILVLLSYLPWS